MTKENAVLLRRRLVPPSDTYFVPNPTASPGLLVGNTVFVAGQVGRERDGSVVKGDITAQFHQVMHNIRVVLHEAGATLDDVVRLTQFVTDLSLAKKILDARRAYFPGGVPPSATIGVARLAHPDWLIEVDAIAVIG